MVSEQYKADIRAFMERNGRRLRFWKVVHYTMNVDERAALVIANAIRQYETSGMCGFGKICDSCDCFATPDDGEDDRLMAKAIYVAYQLKIAEIL